MGISVTQASFIGTVFEGLFYGIYCIVLFLYIRLRFQKRTTDTSPLHIPLVALFVLCTVFFAVDFTLQYFTVIPQNQPILTTWSLNVTGSIVYTFIDLISQGILIYRCWVMWNRQYLFVIIPSVLALTSFATALTLSAELIKIAVALQHPSPQFLLDIPKWFTPMGTASFSISLGVNAIITGLLTLKLYMLHREITRTWMVSASRGRINLLPAISMLIESGMFTFIGQAVYVIFFSIGSNVFLCVSSPITMVYGITPSLLIVRISMQNIDNQISKFESDIHFGSNNNPSNTINIGSVIDNSSKVHTENSINDINDPICGKVLQGDELQAC